MSTLTTVWLDPEPELAAEPEGQPKPKTATVTSGAVKFKTPTASPTAGLRGEQFYDYAAKCFWIQDSRGAWMQLNCQSMTRHLDRAGFSSGRPRDGGNSPADDQLCEIQLEHGVDYAGPLAGFQSGYVEQCGTRILVTNSPVLVKPEKGEWPVLGKLLENLFLGADGIDQRPFVFGWLKVAITALHTGEKRPGQVLCLAGPAGCGKSMLQNLLTPMLGGRSAKPYRYMSGKTQFNLDLFGAEHLMIEDEVPSADMRARREFGTRIKELVVNETQSAHGKHKNALNLSPFWRVSLSTNDEPENLMVLPPLDDSMADKVMLLKANHQPTPMPTGTDEERRKYRETLLRELPAFVHFLIHEWSIPAELRSERYGVREFHHPDLTDAIQGLSDETHLLRLVDHTLLGEDLTTRWKGTSDELERSLRESASGHEAGRLLYWRNAIGTLLGRLAKSQPMRVRSYRKNNSGRLWEVVREGNEFSSTAKE